LHPELHPDQHPERFESNVATDRILILAEAIRFLAFQNKLNCLRDAWFVFDLLLVVSMILEPCLQ
jgi:hypothetical protein